MEEDRLRAFGRDHTPGSGLTFDVCVISAGDAAHVPGKGQMGARDVCVQRRLLTVNDTPVPVAGGARPEAPGAFWRLNSAQPSWVGSYTHGERASTSQGGRTCACERGGLGGAGYDSSAGHREVGPNRRATLSPQCLRVLTGAKTLIPTRTVSSISLL